MDGGSLVNCLSLFASTHHILFCLLLSKISEKNKKKDLGWFVPEEENDLQGEFATGMIIFHLFN